MECDTKIIVKYYKEFSTLLSGIGIQSSKLLASTELTGESISLSTAESQAAYPKVMTV